MIWIVRRWLVAQSKTCRALWLLLLSMPLLCGFRSPVFVDSEFAPNYRISVEELQTWAQMQEMPTVSASAVLVYDVDANRVLLARNADQALPVASLTKLMTALLVIEKGSLLVPVTVQAQDLVGDSNMGLQIGESISVENLLYGLLIKSANDAAMTLARHTEGSISAFVEKMNQRARTLGLTQTIFLNPHGLDQKGHLSSANDLLIMTQALWKYPLFRKIVSTANIVVAGHSLVNTNELLGAYPGVNGVKTGTTDQAGECLVTGIEQDGHQRFIIIIGSADRYYDTRTLIATTNAAFVWTELTTRRVRVHNRVYLNDGSLRYLRAEGSAPVAFLSTLDRNAPSPAYQLDWADQTNWKLGAPVGMVEWRVGEQVLGQQKLILE